MMELDLIYPNLKDRHPKMEHNDSKKFECIFSTIDIQKTNSIMLNNLEGSSLGIWSAHGEGKFNFKNQKVNIMQSFIIMITLLILMDLSNQQLPLLK